ncbi:hypothetical protein [Curtobacterium sp. MCPF17_052]|uniref:hypothetical protein n=1 Tax=Curtobacterium sp. MCPF17_052 TaxID=2175655 RepID=UPI0024DF7BE1|nr:hypothetical protein [Curtobacterium sp. MCPF17_052]WIB11674.1 hypothetical protein DEJ36_12125 [Curtobacterium sp. MCPF17_052]
MTNPETSAPTGAIVAVSGNDTGGAIQDLAGMYAGRTWYSSPRRPRLLVQVRRRR